MSLAPSSHGLKSSIGKIARYTALAMLIFGLQIGLPRVSNLAASKLTRLFNERDPDSWVQFASARLRMDRFFYPRPRVMENIQCLSSAICGNELTILIAAPKVMYEDWVASFQLLRCDLQSGSIHVTAAPAGVRHLLSDGKTVWQLPEHPENITPFVWENSPTAVARYSKNRLLRCLIKFIDGAWVETDQFVLLPKDYLLTNQPGDQPVEVCPVNDRVITLLLTPTHLYFRTSLELGSEAEATAALKAKQNRSWANFFGQGENRFPGWKQTHRLPMAFRAQDRSGNPLILMPDVTSNQERPFPRLVLENDQLFIAQTCVAQSTGNSRIARQAGIEYVSLEDPNNKTFFAASQIPWERIQDYTTNRILAGAFLGAAGANLATDRGQLHVTTAMDGRTYVFNFGRNDGRKVLMELTDHEMHFVGQMVGGIEWLCYIDVAIAFAFAFAIPMLMLALIARGIERRRGGATYQTAHQKSELASIMSRGVARMIDQGLIAAIVIWSIVIHPAALGWWLFVVEGPDSNRLKSISKGVSWNLAQQSIFALQDYVVGCLAVPCNWWIIAIALVVIPIQIVVQGRTGWTLGKWIMGIRAIRTTLRPCGVSRSILREILALGDSLLFVSWVPGTISALATQHRQRLSDLMADTIVVKNTKEVQKSFNPEPTATAAAVSPPRAVEQEIS